MTAARSLLVTGGAGFIGANFVRYWLDANAADRVTVLDALTYAGNERSLDAVAHDARFRFIRGDVADAAAVAAALDRGAVDTIVHFAAETHVDRSIAEPDAFVRTNVVGTYTLLQAARARWASLDGAAQRRFRFHHVSTDEVFGELGADDPALTERAPCAPNSPYAASKAAGDHFVRAWHRTYGLPVTTSNCSNNYGPYQFPDKFVPLVIASALDGAPVPVYGDGLQRRDWLHVADHCRGLHLVLDKGQVGECYNIGGGSDTTNLALARALCRRVDARLAGSAALRARFAACPAARGGRTDTLIAFVADRPGHDRRYALDSSRARDELGYAPGRDLERGLDETVDWYLTHEDWWRPLRTIR